nr:ribonucleoside-diphosphate reductase large subunit-like [Ipomoea batatas]
MKEVKRNKNDERDMVTESTAIWDYRKDDGYEWCKRGDFYDVNHGDQPRSLPDVKEIKKGSSGMGLSCEKLLFRNTILGSCHDVVSDFMLYDCKPREGNNFGVGIRICMQNLGVAIRRELYRTNDFADAEANNGGDDVFLCEYEYDIHWHSFKRIADIDDGEELHIDVDFYPVETAKNSNLRHRFIGIGVQGLADTFTLLGMAFYSPEAEDLNTEIFETTYYHGLKASSDLAAKEEGPL